MHQLDEAARRHDAAPERLQPMEIRGIVRQCERDMSAHRLVALASSLLVAPASLRSLGLGWHAERSLYTFPMRDGRGEVVGIRTRDAMGGKRCLRGSRLGIIESTTPATLDADWLLVCEGESDAAAAIDLGFRAIARPGCETCVDTIVRHVARAAVARVAIVADADEPGQRGAHALARRLALAGHFTSVLTPPDGAKDLRAWKNTSHGTHHDLAALLDAPPQKTIARTA